MTNADTPSTRLAVLAAYGLDLDEIPPKTLRSTVSATVVIPHGMTETLDRIRHDTSALTTVAILLGAYDAARCAGQHAGSALDALVTCADRRHATDEQIQTALRILIRTHALRACEALRSAECKI